MGWCWRAARCRRWMQRRCWQSSGRLVGIGFPNRPERCGLLDTRYFWVGLISIYTTIFVLGIGSLGRPNKNGILR
jgi:hypothetical protein